MKKKAAKKKPKKTKAALDDDELFLDACIAQDKTWPNKVLAAIGSIRHLTSSESDYKRWAKDEQLFQWPSPEDLTTMKESHDFRLKKFTFFNPSRKCQKNQGIYDVRAAVQLEAATRSSPVLTPDYIEETDQLVETEHYTLGDYLYETGENKVKSIVFCMECQGCFFHSKEKEVGKIDGVKCHTTCSSYFHQVKFEL